MAQFETGSDRIIVESQYGVKLMALAQMVQHQHIEQLYAREVACQANIDNAQTWIRLGKKYDKIDVGSSGSLMIERATGEIFGIKAYGKIHRGHAYGTLDTINEWYWGHYYPQKKENS